MQADNDDTKQAASSSSATITLPDIGGHSSVMRRTLAPPEEKEEIEGASALFDGLLKELHCQPINQRVRFTTGIEKVRQPGQSKADFERKRMQRCAEQAEYDRLVCESKPEWRTREITPADVTGVRGYIEGADMQSEGYVDAAITVARAEVAAQLSGAQVDSTKLPSLDWKQEILKNRAFTKIMYARDYQNGVVCDDELRRELRSALASMGGCVVKAEGPAMIEEQMRIRKILADVRAVLPTQFAVGYNHSSGTYDVKPDTLGLMVDLIDHLPGPRVLEFVERVSGESTREFALRKDVVGALQVFTGCNRFMSVKPGTELLKLVDAFYQKHEAARCLYLTKTLQDPLGLIVSEDVLREVFRAMKRPQGSLLTSLNAKHESIMDGPRSWAELGVDLGRVPHFLRLWPIFQTNHTFRVVFEVEPATFVLGGMQFSFVEPYHCLELYKNEAVGGPFPGAKTTPIYMSTYNASKFEIRIPQYESTATLTFEDMPTCEAHLAALQQLRKVCAERMQAEYRAKHGEAVTFSDLNAKLLRTIKVRDRTEILHNMVVYVIHHLGAYKHNVQDPRYPELIPIVLRILDRWEKDADSLKTEIARKGDVFNDLLQVMQHLSLRHERSYGKTEIDPERRPFEGVLKHDPAYLVDYLTNLSLGSDEDEESEPGLIYPEREVDEEDELVGIDDSSKKSVKRPATPEPLRPETECKKPAAS